jgi:CubicO group peptidase (beta-lactamase class C family)
MWQDPHYADGAYAIIGRALESVVGMSYEDYITQHIFKPLGRSPMVTSQPQPPLQLLTK